MKQQFKWSALNIAYYHQRDSKNQLLATFVGLLVHSSLSAESQQCLSILYEASKKVTIGTFPK